ncbi:Transmembrane protein [Gossypium arboreum]|uniref:Transmembrane protein n=1 Tax=Gossypium arboreum TaxID=29729 RepID=A0A0B0MD82_GOSAR|nr:Transmembrane protein [Gossypium arboreum]
MTSVSKLARGSKDVRARFTLSTNLLGIVNLSILSMAFIGTWYFRYMSYWVSQMCWLLMI